jgi:hypothetical protein
MQVGEQHLPRAQLRALGQLRLFHLHDEVGVRKHLVGGFRDLRARAHVIGIRTADAGARFGFDQHFMAGIGEFAHRGGDQTDTVFVNLDLAGHSDTHGSLRQGLGCAHSQPLRSQTIA